MGNYLNPGSTMGLNLPESSDSAQQQAILDALPVLVFLERGGKVVYANAEARQMLGVAEVSWVERPVEDVLWGLFPGKFESHTPVDGALRSSSFHATLPGRDGRLLPVVGTYGILSASLREAVIVAHLDDRDRAPKSRLMEDVLSSLPESVVILHDKHVLYTNPAFTRMFGYSADEVSGADLEGLIVPETRQHENGMLEKTVAQHGHAMIETTRLNKKGELLDVALAAAPLHVNGTRIGLVLSYRDIGERKQVEAKLQHDAMHDTLTGLPNRALFLDRLTLALTRRIRRRDQSCGVMFLDLDRFKEINDTLGHAAGDVLLIEVSKRLCLALRPQDTAARLGGDEFAVLVENIQAISDLDIVANRILTAMARPFEIFGHSLTVGVSIGVAMAGPDHIAPELLIRDADFAMYRAKQEGGGRLEIFDKHLKLQVTSQQERERELRRVLDKREYELWYQPIFRLQSGKLEGMESFLRWRRSDGSVDSFRDLLAVAEDTGLSITIGRETVESVCRQLRSWTEALPLADLTLTVNLTHRQFYHPDMVAQLKRALALTRAEPERILIEISENTLIDSPDSAGMILQRMVDCGVRVALDDFGATLGPLNYLVRLPIHVVKLHPKLTHAATSSGRQIAMLESLIHLGRTLGVQVVAQGIDTQEQLEALSMMGCELGQGPFLSPALEPSLARKLAAEGHWAIVARQ